MKNFFLITIIIFIILGSSIYSYDLNKIKKNGKIVIGLDDTFAPMGFKNKAGKIVGFDIDLAKKFAKKLGVKLVLKPCVWSNIIFDLKSKRIDLIWNGLDITEGRKKQINFSTPYIQENQAIIVQKNSKIKNKSDLKNKIIGVQLGSTAEYKLEKNTISNKIKFRQLKKYDSYIDALLDLSNQRIDAIVVNKFVALYYLKQDEHNTKKQRFKILASNFGKTKIAVGIRKKDINLKKELDNFIIASQKNKTIKKLKSKWFANNFDTKNIKTNRQSLNNIFKTTLYIFKGLGVSLAIYLITLFSIPLGFILCLGSISTNKLLKKSISIYNWIFRGTPLLLQLFFVYYGLPIIGIKLNAFVAASLTFVVNYAAYLSEIFRSGIESIDKGQFEACQVLGFNKWQTMYKIILPQATKRMLPAFSNEAITLVKDTALVSVIGINEMLRNSQEIATRDFTIFPFIIAGIFYLLFSVVILKIFKKFEGKK